MINDRKTIIYQTHFLIIIEIEINHDFFYYYQQIEIIDFIIKISKTSFSC